MGQRGPYPGLLLRALLLPHLLLSCCGLTSCPTFCRCLSSFVQCVEANQTGAFPWLGQEESGNISTIYVENRAGLKSLSRRDLEYYSKLRNLTIANTGLENVDADAFEQSPMLQYLNLSSNALVTLSWKPFAPLRLTELILTGNSFRCSCEIRWLQIWLESGVTAVGNQSLSCWQDGSATPLEGMQVPDCGLAEPVIDLENATVKEGESLTLWCNASGEPRPSIRWLTEDLRSNYSIQLHEQAMVLTLFHIVPEENGNNITCQAENLVGPVDVSVTLSVLYKAEILSLLDAVNRHNWCFSFVVRGNPRPSTRWIYDSAELPDNRISWTVIYDEEPNEIHGCRELASPTHCNNGNYTLVVENALGGDRRTARGHFMEGPLDICLTEPTKSVQSSTLKNTAAMDEEPPYGVRDLGAPSSRESTEGIPSSALPHVTIGGHPTPYVSADICVTNPCGNGGTCVEVGSTFTCVCLPSYSGRVCQLDEVLCEVGWQKFLGSCYKVFRGRRPWESAEEQCRAEEAHLTSIMNPEEQSFINEIFKEYQWIGLNDKIIENDFQWSDGNQLLYENWQSGQPDSFFAPGENCVVMVWQNGGHWSDVPCNYFLAFTCKKVLSSKGMRVPRMERNCTSWEIAGM
ncbi:NT-3 growth factor receptor-like [Scyliorhinus torazame]|uniref:NT-3 growth factor receptor-like n=1 Tax=Scyliorhinus torazame TaxID=75743 RepID=UPI003B5C01BA